MTRRPTAAAIVLAAGESRRMDGVDKLFAPVGGTPVLLRSLRTFARSEAVDSVVVAAARGGIGRVRQLAREVAVGVDSRKPIIVVEGGARRQDSVAAALAEIRGAEIVLVHDGARPFVSGRVISDAVRNAAEYGAAVPAIPVKDTIKLAAADMTVADTPPRSRLWAAQTPQAFRADILREAHRRVSADATDDAAMVEALGIPVNLFAGDPRNIKITAPEDLAVADAIARALGDGGDDDDGEGGAA